MSGWLQRNRSLLVIGLGTARGAAGRGAPRRRPEHRRRPRPGEPRPARRPGPGPGARRRGRRRRRRARPTALEDQSLGADTTVARHLAGEARPEHGRPAARRRRGTARVVVAEPGRARSRRWASTDSVELHVVDGSRGRVHRHRSRRPAGLEIEVDTATLLRDHGRLLPGARAAARWPRAGDGVVLLGAAGILTNDQILRADNAAVALRLLGQRPRLVWYVPSLDRPGRRRRRRPALACSPAGWCRRSGCWAIADAGRRAGGAVAGSAPLATEPLPVAVRRSRRPRPAAGSTARARRPGARRRRAAPVDARATLAGPPAPGPPSDVSVLVRDVAARLDRPTDDIAALLGDGATAPATDDELIRLATALAELDREVRRT